YARRLSGWLGMDERTVLRAVHDAARAEGREARPRPGEERPAPQRAGEGEGAGEEPVIPVARLSDVVSPRDPVGQVEVQSLAVMLQSPVLLSAQQVGALPDDAFHVPALQGVWDVMLAAGTLLDAVEGTLSPARYLDQVLEIAGETVRPLIVEITALGLAASHEADLALLAASWLDRLSELSITRASSVRKQRLRRTVPADGERYQEILTRLAQVQDKRRSLRPADDCAAAGDGRAGSGPLRCCRPRRGRCRCRGRLPAGEGHGRRGRRACRSPRCRCCTAGRRSPRSR